MKKILFIIIAGLISFSVNAQKWYVATTGDDANGDGSITYPWKTVKHAADTITDANGFAGDTIMVGAGTFLEPAQVILSDSIFLMGAGESLSRIKFSYANSTWSNACIELESATEGTYGAQSISHLTIDGDSTAYHGILIGRRSKVKLHDLTMEDFKYNAIHFRGSYLNETTPVIYAKWNELYNCTITNCCDKEYIIGQNGNGQVRISGQDGLLIHDNIIDNTIPAAGFGGDNFDMVLGYNKGMQFYNNKSYKPDHNGSAWNIHVESWDVTGGNHYYNNEFWGGGIQLDIGGHFNIRGDYEYSNLVENNFFGDTEQKAYVSGLYGVGVMVEGNSRDVIIRKNYFKYIGKGISLNGSEYTNPARIYDVLGVQMHYNIFENIGYTNENSWVIELVSESVNAVVEDIYIDNNIMINSALYPAEAALMIMPKGTMNNIRLRNNIIDSMRLAPIYMYYYTGQVSNLYNQNNLLYKNGNDNLIKYYLTPTVINYVVADTIMDADPLFVGTGTPPLNYKLTDGSPAKDAGISVGLTSDYGGYTVPVGPLPDIGAWEYGADIDPNLWTPKGIGWEPVYYKQNIRDTTNFRVEPLIAGTLLGDAILGLTGITSTINDLNATAGATGNFQGQLNTKASLAVPAFTSSITIAGDTTVTAVIGKIIYQAADSSFYGCRSTVAPKKWYKLND